MKSIRISEEAYLNHFMSKQFVDNNIQPEFPADIAALTAGDLKPAPCRKRMDLRHVPCLTIDGSDTKDMDDALSMTKTENGFQLGVHIADVASFVTPGSRLDEVAMMRGSSIYLANRTIPMLPPCLSNDLCSLNPNTDRYAMSVLIDVTNDGQIGEYTITKSVIRSRVKGAYHEVNRILSFKASQTEIDKYREVLDPLFDLNKLAKILRDKRCKAGANVNQNNEVKATLRDGEVELTTCDHGDAEILVEEMMVLANSLVAKYCHENELPCLYRVQEEKQTLARYDRRFTRHAELAIGNQGYYTHFTSPIRRISDTIVHQILTDWLNGATTTELNSKYCESCMEECALFATKRLRRAKTMQDLCSNFCYACYFSRHCRESYRGCVIGFNNKGFPVICMDEYPIHVLGDFQLDAHVGDHYVFRIAAEFDTRKLYAQTPVRIPA